MVQVSACDSLTDWTTTNGGDALDAIDKKEGSASIEVIGNAVPGATVVEEYDPAGTWDWSTYDHITLWYQTEERTALLQFRIWSGANEGLDFLLWTVKLSNQITYNDVWYRVKLYFNSFDISGGAINMAAVRALNLKITQTAPGTTFHVDDIRVDGTETIIVKIGSVADHNYVNDDTIEADIWRDSLSGIGRWQVILENPDNKWGDMFLPDEDVEIRINGVLMMNGYVDDVIPFLAPRGEYTNRIKVIGRDYGMDLAQLYITADYAQDNADDIVDLALAAAGSEITYASPTVAAVIDFEFNRTYLADGIRDICKLIDYDFYVQNDAARTLQLFAVGAVGQHTAVNLTAVAAAATNNILKLEKGEKIGADIKNYIEAHAGGLIDHWTDLNASDWSGAAAAACTISDDLVIFLDPKGAIRATATGATDLIADLDFTGTLYEYATLDMSERNEGSYLCYKHYVSDAIVMKACRIWLKDADDEWIEFYKSKGIANCAECTDDNQNDLWRKVVFPYGEGLEIKAVGSFISDFWQFRPGSGPAFDWSNIETIRFISDTLFPRDAPDYFIVDGLEIPDVEVISIEQDAGIGSSQAKYGIRMLPIYRPDIKNQVELDAFTLAEEPKYKDPLETIKITAIGQTGSVYAGQSLNVRAPDHGIAALTKYRIMKLHHQVVKSSDDSPVAGYIFLTDYDLVKDEINPTQVIDPVRFARYKTPVEATIRDMRDKLIRLTKLDPDSSSSGPGGGSGPGGVVPYYIDGADIAWYDTGPAYAMLRPETTGAIDLGSNAIKWGDIWGIVHYSDLYMSDLECPLCGERFKPEDALNLTVREVIKKKNELDEEYEEIRCVPTHKRCPLLARIRKWLRELYRGK